MSKNLGKFSELFKIANRLLKYGFSMFKNVVKIIKGVWMIFFRTRRRVSVYGRNKQNSQGRGGGGCYAQKRKDGCQADDWSCEIRGKKTTERAQAQAKEHAAAYLKEGEKQAEADYEAAMNQARETAESLVKDAEARKKQAIETIAERIIEISVNH